MFLTKHPGPAEHDAAGPVHVVSLLEGYVATAGIGHRFRHWRRRRPFWGGLLLVLSGLAMFFSANLTLGDLKVHFGQEGYLSYLLPAIMLLCGTLILLTPAQRLFYAVIGLLTALYSLIGLNLGGFGAGMLLGIVGGALAIAWTPVRPAAVTESAATANTGPAATADTGPAATTDTGPAAPADTGETAPIAPAEEDPLPFDRPAGEDGPTAILPGFRNERDGEPGPPSGGGAHRKMLVITLVPMLVLAGLVLAGGRSPARADTDCPEGLPSRPAAEASREAARQPSRSATARPAKKTRTAVSAGPSGEAADPSRSTAPGPAETADGAGNPVVDGLNGLVEGVGDLLGIGAEGSPSASADPAPSPSAPAPTAGPSSPAPDRPGPSGGASPTASPFPAPSSDDVPCLGPRVHREAGAADVPTVGARPGLLETKSLTMYDSTYDGVVTLRTAKGPLRALKFSMRRAVNKPFSLTIPEAGGRDTVITSNELATDGHVRFYTPKFVGKLFGLIPVTFTPESPPPLTLPVLRFTEVEIDLAFVRCDTLTADPLKVNAPA
jgi:hypothetical protein